MELIKVVFSAVFGATLIAVACLGSCMLVDGLVFPRGPSGRMTMEEKCFKAGWEKDGWLRGRKQAECERWIAAGRPKDWK